ncbi:caspase, EACC1-associated type [Kitasatospora xanthocidica]|nr:caspase family protein [Kitasatospora xanthocidica]
MSGEPIIPPGSRAILIGVPRYQKDARYRSYTAVGNSVEGMYHLLVESGLCGWREEQVEKIVDPTNAGQLMGRLRQLAAETTGVLLFYFVGHGQPSEHTGELCLAIADTDHDNPDATGLEYAKIKRALHSGTPAATRIAILDCCYSGRAIGLSADEDGTQLANLSHCAGAYTLTAADERAHVPPDGEGHPRTAFTGELLDLLTRDGVPGGPDGLALGVIFPHLQHRLATKGLPRPNQRSDDAAAAFVFACNHATPPPGQPLGDADTATSASTSGAVVPRQDADVSPVGCERTHERPAAPLTGRHSAGTRMPTGPRARRGILATVLTAAVVLTVAVGWVMWPQGQGGALPGLTPAGQMTAPTGVDTVVFSHDGHTLATTGVDGTVLLWNTASHQRVGQPIGPIAAQNRLGIAFTADDRALRIVRRGKDSVTAGLWDTTNGQQTQTSTAITTKDTNYALTAEGSNVALAPDGRTLVIASFLGNVPSIAWGLDSGQKTVLEATGYGGSAVTFSPDGHSTAFGGENQLTVADTSSGHTIASLDRNLGTNVYIERIALSPDNRTVAVALGNNTVQLWDIASGEQTGSTLTGLTKSAIALVFSHDGHTLAAAGGNGTAVVWDTASHRRFGDPLTGVYAIAFNPNDQTFVTGGLDHTIQLWTLPPRATSGTSTSDH